MNLEKIRFNIIREFKPEEGKQNFILDVPGSGRLVIPESRIRELPTSMRRKFFMQQGISFRVIMTALNIWIREKDEKSEDPKSSRKIFNPEMEDKTSGP